MLRALVLGVVLIGSACGSSGSADTNSGGEALGPLAVIESEGTGTSDAIGGTGPISIGERCVSMTTGIKELLLVWRSAEISWNDDDRAIRFSSAANADAKPITIRDGDNLTIGGEFFVTEGGAKRNVDWVAEPHDSCTGDWYIVDSVSSVPR